MKNKEKIELILEHDLSLLLLSNELLKDSKPATEEMEMAFDAAFKKSLKKEPTLTNRI